MGDKEKDNRLENPLLRDKEEDIRREAIIREKEFAKSRRDNPDIIKKRTDSDLFKGF